MNMNQTPAQKIVITQAQKDALATHRAADEKRTHLWRAIRDQFRIPKTVKLAVTTARELYVKGTNPKQFLRAVAGRYDHASADPVLPASQSGLVNTPATAPAKPTRFAVATPVEAKDTGWSRVTADRAAVVLRGDTDPDAEDNVTLPDGFPTVDTDFDGLIFDADTGHVYFRTNGA